MTTQTVGHTPGVLETSVNGAGEWDVCREGGGDMIADLSGCDNGKANAARIVLTWNCHDDLVAALKRVLAWLEGQGSKMAGAVKDTRFPGLAEAYEADAKNYRAMASDIKAALAKAEPEGN